MSNVVIYKVYHDLELLKTFECPQDNIRQVYNTSKNEWGRYFNESTIFFDDTIDLNCDFIGIEHYCRLFTEITDTIVNNTLKENSCFVYSYFSDLYNPKEVSYLEYPSCNMKLVKDLLFNYFLKNGLYKELISLKSNYLLILRTMFIMKVEDFIKMRLFIRNIKDYLFEINGISTPEDILEFSKFWKPDLSIFRGTQRIFAFIFEHLVDIWIRSHIPNIIEYRYERENFYEIKYDNIMLDIHLVDHCNLNCRSCLHMALLADKNYLDIDVYEQNLKLISPHILRGFRQVNILGGEPLLHPNITKILEVTRKYFPYNQLVLFTNGILLPKMNELFFETCYNNRIFITISHYPISTIDYDSLKKIVLSYNIQLITGYRGDKKLRGIPYSKISLDLEGKLDNVEQYTYCRNCLPEACLLLQNTKVSPCPYESYIKYFNKTFNTNIKTYEEDFLDLSKIKSFLELIDWLYVPKKFCKYCKVKDIINIDWGLSKKDISEYV